MKKGLTVVFPLYVNRLDEKMLGEKTVGGINTKYPMDGLEMFFP